MRSPLQVLQIRENVLRPSAEQYTGSLLLRWEERMLYINASTIGAEIQLPFGGIKHSGYGRKEAGGRGGALDTYSRWKVIYRDFSGKLQKAQIDK